MTVGNSPAVLSSLDRHRGGGLRSCPWGGLASRVREGLGPRYVGMFGPGKEGAPG